MTLALRLALARTEIFIGRRDEETLHPRQAKILRSHRPPRLLDPKFEDRSPEIPAGTEACRSY